MHFLISLFKKDLFINSTIADNTVFHLIFRMLFAVLCFIQLFYRHRISAEYEGKRCGWSSAKLFHRRGISGNVMVAAMIRRLGEENIQWSFPGDSLTEEKVGAIRRQESGEPRHSSEAVERKVREETAELFFHGASRHTSATKCHT